MRKTYVLFGLALALLFAALVVGLPRRASPPAPVTKAPTPTAPAADTRDSLRLGDAVVLKGRLSSPNLLANQAGQLDLLLDLDAAALKAGPRPPMAIALVIDRSGSMAGPKMRQAKAAAKALVARLSDDDRLALVTYSSDYMIDVDLTRLKGQRGRLERVIDDILDGGGTNLAGGLTAGLKALSRADDRVVRRLILLSDGNANQGLTDPTAIAEIASRARAKGVTISTLGVGVDFNEDLMTSIAQAAGGGYYYARDAAAIATAFDAELKGLMQLVARQVEVALELAPGVRIEEVYGYRTEKRGDRVVIPVGDMASEAHRRVMVRLSIDPAKAGAADVGRVVLAYERARPGTDAEHQGELSVRVVTDAAEVAAGQRADVLEAFTEAEAAKARAEAAATFARGERAAAKARVQRAAARLRTANKRLKSAKISAQIDEMQDTLSGFDSVQSSSYEGKDLVKKEKLRAYEAFSY